MLIGFLFMISFLSDVTSLFLLHYRAFQFMNIPSSVYDVLFILLISYIYFVILRSQHRWILFCGMVLSVFFVLNLVLVQKDAIASHNKFLTSGLVILYAIIYFYKTMVELPSVHLHRVPSFWFNSAFLMYHSGNMFLYAFTSYLIHVLKDDMLAYWTFHNSLGVLQRLLIIVGVSYDLRNNFSISEKKTSL